MKESTEKYEINFFKRKNDNAERRKTILVAGRGSEQVTGLGRWPATVDNLIEGKDERHKTPSIKKPLRKKKLNNELNIKRAQTLFWYYIYT